MADNPEQSQQAAIERAKRKVELYGQLLAITETRRRAGKVAADKVIEAELALLEAETQLATVRAATPAMPQAPSTPANALDTDNSEDTRKKARKAGKRGPRNPSEFLRFKAAIERGQRKGLLKKDVALEFTNGDELKAKALLKKLTRHQNLPP